MPQHGHRKFVTSRPCSHLSPGGCVVLFAMFKTKLSRYRQLLCFITGNKHARGTNRGLGKKAYCLEEEVTNEDFLKKFATVEQDRYGAVIFDFH